MYNIIYRKTMKISFRFQVITEIFANEQKFSLQNYTHFATYCQKFLKFYQVI